MNYYLINYQLNGIGESGESCSSEYDLSEACQTCGTGAKLLGPLIAKGLTNCNKDIFQTKNGDWLISSKLYQSLNSSIKLNLKPVVNNKNQALEFWHLNTSESLPKSNINSSGFVIENQCMTCHRDGHFNDVEIGDLKQGRETIVKPLIFVYNNNFEWNGDIFQTWERYGISNKVVSGNNVIRYARPWLIVSDRVKKLLEELKIPKVSYQQIEINGVQHQL
jgi:hypothetical protein